MQFTMHTTEQIKVNNQNKNTMENLFYYLFVGLSTIFLVSILETLISDFKEIIKSINQNNKN